MDAERLADLYRSYAPLVHARARRILGEGADDVVQEVFLRLVRREPPEDRLTEWIYRVSSNVALDELRRRRRRDTGWEDRLRGHLAENGAPRDAEAALSDLELVRRLLATTDRKTREVVTLVHLDEMTQEDAARVLGVTRRTVSARLARFREHAERSVARWTKTAT